MDELGGLADIEEAVQEDYCGSILFLEKRGGGTEEEFLVGRE